MWQQVLNETFIAVQSEECRVKSAERYRRNRMAHWVAASGAVSPCDGCDE